MAELPSVGNAVQSSEMMRNSLGLNYKSAALPAKLFWRKRPKTRLTRVTNVKTETSEGYCNFVACVLVRLDHVARCIVNADHWTVSFITG
jgi:hypothetical protein